FFFFFSSRRRHTRFSRDWSSDVCSSDLIEQQNDALLVRVVPDLMVECVVEHEAQALLPMTDAVVDPDPAALRCLRHLEPEMGPRSEERRVGKERRALCGAGHGKRKRVVR